jgi:restriction system protein
MDFSAQHKPEHAASRGVRLRFRGFFGLPGGSSGILFQTSTSICRGAVYEIRIKDDRINAYRVIKGTTLQDVEAKAMTVKAAWDEQWRRRQALDEARTVRQQQRNLQLDGARQAAELTSVAEAEIRALDSILSDGCREVGLSWDDLKERSSFAERKPSKPTDVALPTPPIESLYAPTLSFTDKIIPGLKAKKLAEARNEFEKAQRRWNSEVNALKSAKEAEGARHRAAIEQWQGRKDDYEKAQQSQNASIETLKASYENSEKAAVEYLVGEQLARSAYPTSFPIGFDLSFDAESKTLVIDYELPNMGALPQHKEVKFIAKKSELQWVPVTESWRKSTYDKVLYQMALRTISRVFSVDTRVIILSVVFNGWVRSIDPATGSEAHGCILSLQAGRDEFLCLELTRVDPKACFKSLKGVASSRLAELTPIRPIIKLNKEDERFVEAYGVVEEVDERTNLAAMDWQDFENLIREIFEKEFSRNGGEVKITRASRDGGVDAVAFDPDPLRGGKIVIQAKRYTNTVGVSAVRDLFGTVQHEGAMKGILVTTATYGSDAYEFAKDKPITLISGAELLGLLERHGHRAKIDLAEARAAR